MEFRPYSEGEIVELQVDRIEPYGAYFKRDSSDRESVLVLITEISWEPTRHPSLKLSLGEKREVLILSRPAEAEYLGSIRRIETDHPYAALLDLPTGARLTGKVESCVGDKVFLSIAGHPNVEAVAQQESARAAQIGTERTVKIVEIDKKNWRLLVDLT